MKTKIQKYFGLTDKGIKNIFKASRRSFLKYISFTLPPVLVFMFLNDYQNGHLKSLTVYMGILALIVVVMYIVLEREYTQTYDVTFQESVDLRVNIANKLRELPLSYFSKHNLSDLSQTVMMDVNNIEITMSHAIPQSLGFLYFFIIVTIALIVNNPILGICVTFPIWLTIAIVFLSRKSQMKHISKYYNRLLDNSNAFQEAFELQQEIKSYSLQKEVEKDVSKKIEETEKIHILAEFRMAISSFFIGILPYLAPVITAIVGAVEFSNGRLNILYYVGYLMAATTISSQYAALNEYLLTMFFFEDSFRRIRDLQDEQIQKGMDDDIDNFEVSLKNVSFSYGENKVLGDVTFTAKQNEVTAIVGPSGCGKTTVLRLISRLYDYDEGSITIGGKDIKNISTNTLFKNISIVFQDVELFNNSVLENIRVGRKNATDEEVINAAKLANVDKIIEKLPDGYNTVIGENGSKLSGGERQRISIARAFLKDSPIILLDEISASIDVENEKEIQNSINKLITNKTVIIISHRLKSIEKANKIIVMNNGKIDSEGSHEEVLRDSDIYRSMVRKSELTESYVY
ncbi:MAG: ABC transporter ATP-binding protein [Tissierellia bacterium]|nr:ABC transporter ATP-binding protein [Tissierellia bacterium]